MTTPPNNSIEMTRLPQFVGISGKFNTTAKREKEHVEGLRLEIKQNNKKIDKLRMELEVGFNIVCT